MKTQAEEVVTRLFEVVAQFRNFKEPLFCHIDSEDLTRLVNCFERESDHPLGYYGFGLVPGLDCWVNAAHVTQVHALNYLAGLPFKKLHVKTEEEEEADWEARNESEDPVVLRVWRASTGTVEDFHDVDYHEWIIARCALDCGNQQFIGFDDDDGERVILSVADIAAIQVFDTYYLTDEQLEVALKRRGTTGDRGPE